jgi:uncharacterized protein
LARFERSAMAQPEERKVDIEGLAASYMRPTSEESASTAVIIAGSGPTDRDGNNTLGLKTDTYKLLAHALAERGVASVRYDKRGVAGSAGIGLPEQQLTIRTFANDAVAVVRWADRQAPGVPVVLLGHSEGGLLALLAAGPAQAKAVVLLATPGRRLGTILCEQFSRPGIPERLSDEAKRIVSSLEKGEPVASVSAELTAAFRPSVQPFLMSVMQVDPSRELQAVTAPVLVVGGGRDAQLGRSDFDALAGARPGLATHWEPTMGHTLKPVRDDDPRQVHAYTDPTVALSEGLADRVAAFVRGVSRQ